MIARNLVSLVAAVVGAACACSSSKASAPPAPLPVVACDSAAALNAVQAFAATDIAVALEAPSGSEAMLDPVRADLAKYLGAMWGAPVSVGSTTPDFGAKMTLWLSTSDSAKSAVGADAGDGYAIERAGSRVIVWGRDAAMLSAGTYALLEELGARFFHPRQDFVPTLGGPRIPSSLHLRRAPAVQIRGLQLHTLHPIEWMASFNEPSADHLAEAKQLIDWLVKTGQNHVQWCLLGDIDFAAWKPHAQAIVDYAHARGVTVGAVVQVWGGAALQNNYVLVTDAAQWQAQMDAKLDTLTTVSWDAVELALGEFAATDPQSVIDWLSHATDYTLKKLPNAMVDVQNHVGNYPQLWVQYQGQKVFYYHLPQFSDPRLGQSVHTLFFFDLYRDWAMYNHPDFHLQRDYILKELPSRRVTYFPESAYWVTADVDVPAFMPEFIQARYLDISTLVPEIAKAGLPPLAGHVMFSSGHEWGYWLTDYLTAKMLWSTDTSLDGYFGRYAAAYGSCSGDVAGALSQLTAIQSKYLFDQRLVGSISGEDSTIDVGYLAGIPTHPRGVRYEDIIAMSDADRATFETATVAALESMAGEIQPLEDAVAARCRGSDAALAPWCNELWDGMAVVRLRATHAATLYRAALAYARGDKSGASSKVDAARKITDAAAAVITKREAGYRFEVARLTDAYDNPTYYKFGYLHQSHTQCYWRRREDQMQSYIDNDAAAPLGQLRTCDN